MNKSLVTGLILLVVAFNCPLLAQPPVDADGHVIDFQRDIVPILQEKCLECHGPEEAKNDFRVDDPSVMADYLEAGDADSSSLYIDYLVASGDDFEDYLMPPLKKGGPLSPSELALIRLWIQEGADWPEDATFASPGEQPAVIEKTEGPTEPDSTEQGLLGRVWAFQGYFHPATVHFPVALLTFGAFFVVMGYKWPQLAHPIPFFCLVFGALSAVGASAMGWSFADQEGYGSWTRGLDHAIERHRWGGILVTVLSVVFALIAIRAELKNDESKRKVWQIGLLVCAGIVGLVGHIGGELTYGEEFYHKALEILLGKG